MMERGNRSGSAAAIHTVAAAAGRMQEDSKASTDTGMPAIESIRRLTRVNLILVGLQGVSAGVFLSGYERAVTAHAVAALALVLGVLAQAIVSAVFWRRGRVPAWMGGFGLGMLAVTVLQMGLGHAKLYWLHVPIGVGMFGGFMRQSARLDAIAEAAGERS